MKVGSLTLIDIRIRMRKGGGNLKGNSIGEKVKFSGRRIVFKGKKVK